MKNTLLEINNVFDGFISRLNIVEKPEGRQVNRQTET